MKKRILFVDDEPNVLQGLQRMLRPMRNEWDVAFASGGPEALQKLAAEPFDVVVSDMRMPGMDGAQLLTEVMRHYPQTVRIVLSGHSDQEMILRSVGPAHQYLAKPCDAETLKSTVARACALHDLLTNESLKKLVSGTNTLPSQPALYAEMVRLLQSPNTSVEEVSRLIAQDVGMTAKILQLVNSAFFGLRRRVSNPSEAAVFLGLDTIKALVLSVQIFSLFERPAMRGFALETVWKHSLATATAAKHLAATEKLDRASVEHAFLGGLLHDAGKLVLATNIRDRYAETIALANQRKIPLWQAERETLGATHAEVGAALLGIWGLPDPILEVIAFHHEPRKCLAKGFTTLTAVHVANTLVASCGEPPQNPSERFTALTAVHVADVLDWETTGDGLAGARAALDTDYLAAIGAAERIDAWRRSLASLVPGRNAE
ncbi:MAG TPA: response regulator [Phycisphaerae bacterium]|nr:response regulator [Phycisphaerae bacterium]